MKDNSRRRLVLRLTMLCVLFAGVTFFALDRPQFTSSAGTASAPAAMCGSCMAECYDAYHYCVGRGNEEEFEGCNLATYCSDARSVTHCQQENCCVPNPSGIGVLCY